MIDVREGDCVEVMEAMDPDSIDAVVTDPPYLIGFMGKTWDKAATANTGHRGDARAAQAFHERWALAAIRVAKPGAYLLSFGGAKTHHRMAVAIEDAGWEIRDEIVWGYASGMPKGGDIGKAIDRRQKREHVVTGKRMVTNLPARKGSTKGYVAGADRYKQGLTEASKPSSEDGRRWEGWATQLKPAWEPILVARKPFSGSLIDNVLTHGTGALNVRDTSLAVDPHDPVNGATWSGAPSAIRPGTTGFISTRPIGEPHTALTAETGRWPADVVLTDPIFDGQFPDEVVGGGAAAGMGKSGWKPSKPSARFGKAAQAPFGPGHSERIYNDAGSYSRFFLIAKAGHRERQGTGHPTVKPVKLMMHLLKLVLPPGGLALDPFGGSGSTGVAAKLLGMDAVLIERDPESVASARTRLDRTMGALIRSEL